MSHAVTFPILPCPDIDVRVTFYEALGFERTYRQDPPEPVRGGRPRRPERSLYGIDGTTRRPRTATSSSRWPTATRCTRRSRPGCADVRPAAGRRRAAHAAAQAFRHRVRLQRRRPWRELAAVLQSRGHRGGRDQAHGPASGRRQRGPARRLRVGAMPRARCPRPGSRPIRRRARTPTGRSAAVPRQIALRLGRRDVAAASFAEASEVALDASDRSRLATGFTHVAELLA